MKLVTMSYVINNFEMHDRQCVVLISFDTCCNDLYLKETGFSRHVTMGNVTRTWNV